MGIQLLPSANALEVYQGVMTEMARLEKSFPPGLEWRLAFDNVGVVRESIKEVLVTLARGHRPRHPGDVPVPAELAQHAHPRHHHPRLADRHLRLRQALRLLDQHPDPVRDRARHRDRGGRRDRRDREHRAPHARGEEELLPGRHRRHARGVRRGGGHRPRAGGGVRARGLLPRHHRPALPAVLAHHRLRRGPLRLQRGDLHPRPLRAAPGQGEPRPRPVLHRREPRDRRAAPTATCALLKRALALRPLMLGLFALGLLGTWWLFQTVPSAFVPDEDEGYFITHHPGPGGRVARVHDRTSPSRRRPSSSRTRTSRPPSPWWGSASAARRRTTA